MIKEVMCVQQNDDKFMIENTHFMCIIKRRSIDETERFNYETGEYWFSV